MPIRTEQRAGASQMGADVVLLERGKMGGDCLNYGCVPSKALLAAGHKRKSFARRQHLGSRQLIQKSILRKRTSMSTR